MFAGIWRFPLWIILLVRIGCSCYKLLLVRTVEKGNNYARMLFFRITLPNYRNRLRIKKVIVKARRGGVKFVCVYIGLHYITYRHAQSQCSPIRSTRHPLGYIHVSSCASCGKQRLTLRVIKRRRSLTELSWQHLRWSTRRGERSRKWLSSEYETRFRESTVIIEDTRRPIYKISNDLL